MGFTFYHNRRMLSIPVVTPIHLIIARLILETLGAVLVCIIFTAFLALVGYQIMPLHVDVAIVSIFASIYFGIGLGLLIVVLSAVLGVFVIHIFVVLMVAAYLTSGVYFPVRSMSDPARSILREVNPILNLVEWMRSAYFTSYDPDLINKSMVLVVATTCLFIGLAGERYLRNLFYR